MKYVGRRDLENVNCHIVIIDITASIKLRLICLYRSFRPQDSISPTVFFETQLNLLKRALTGNCYLLGDFNLDARMDMRPVYDYKVPLSSLTTFALENNLVQMVTETTWSRTINGVRKDSLLDHVYVNNAAIVLSVNLIDPVFGDHSLIVVKLTFKSQTFTKSLTSRNWKNYNAVCVCHSLAIGLNVIKEKCINMSVQDHWNQLENVLISSIDESAPLLTYNIKVKRNSGNLL